jgi:hypothetical protein
LVVSALAFSVYASHPFDHSSGGAGATSEPPGTVTEAPSAVLSQAPYMGVHCAVANSIACDRVGLAVWLKRRAYSVVAWIDGRRVLLDWFGDQRIEPAGLRKAFTGYLHPAGIVSSMHVQPLAGSDLWMGDQAPVAFVRLLIDYGRGRHVATRLGVQLAAGW